MYHIPVLISTPQIWRGEQGGEVRKTGYIAVFEGSRGFRGSDRLAERGGEAGRDFV
jgi:hypothetical protein